MPETDHRRPLDERLRPRQRLRRRQDFLRCYRSGRKRHGRFATLHVHANEQGVARLGITASRKVGKAVVRHRTKRRVREIFRRWPGRASLPPLDVVVHVKRTAAEADFAALRAELERQLATLQASR
ncbi:MAG: ribonuclease P protein component [Acidobacteria bacterium]|nr:MAG: ribonuclease P protein component [Acidobacteriota bacterium]